MSVIGALWAAVSRLISMLLEKKDSRRLMGSGVLAL